MKIIVYGTQNCTKCKIFINRLSTKNLSFVKIEDEEKIKAESIKANILSLPIVKIDNEYYTYESAIKKLF